MAPRDPSPPRRRESASSPSRPPTPLVLHVDVDAFFASVEQLRNPRLAGRPVAVGSGVIASCSYEARAHGLSAGMPLRQAERLCPGLVVVEGHQSIYHSYGERVFELCHEWAPQVETLLDDAYCDLSGTDRLYPDPAAVGRQLQARVRDELGLGVTIGIGRNRVFARLAGRRERPAGLTRIGRDEEESLLLGLRVEELPGIGPRTKSVLEKLGIDTVRELRQLPRPALEALFGLSGRTIYERCRGEDHRCIEPREIPRTVSRESAFHDATDDPREIEGLLHYLVERAARSLRERRLEASGIAVRIGYLDGVRERGRRRLDPPSARDVVLVAAALELRRSLHRRRVALRRVGIVLDGVRPQREYLQPSLFADGEAAGDPARDPPELENRERRLLASLDAIRDRHGHGAVVTGKSLHLMAAGGRDGEPLPRDRDGFILRTPSLTK